MIVRCRLYSLETLTAAFDKMAGLTESSVCAKINSYVFLPLLLTSWPIGRV